MWVRRYFLVPEYEVTQDMLSDSFKSLYARTGTYSDIARLRRLMKIFVDVNGKRYLIIKYASDIIPTSFECYYSYTRDEILEIINK
jgi:hypothetical protein